MSLLDILVGRPVANDEEESECIGAAAGIPIFGLDALSSAAYGPEAALTLLIGLGAAGVAYIVPITGCIIVLLAIVYFSYRQTIAEYPGGGGSYTVATENLGPYTGLLAGAALMIDYILVVAVGISAGVGALVSAVPSLQPHTLGICLGILVLITIVNLRGVREAGLVFMAPTYLFVGTLLITIGLGIVKSILAGGHPAPIVAPPHPGSAAMATASVWLLLQTFANGCTAMTGVEAVSNGVRAFRKPTVPNAQRTLTVVIGLLIVLLAGIAWLVRAYDIVASNPGRPGYQSLLSLLVAAVVGHGWFYYVTIGSVLIILSLSANTAFSGFPRLCKTIAEHGFLPHSFGHRGRRLVYTQGILVLAVLSAILLIVFGGVTDRLIPLFAIGAFMAFTLSQAGMVAHWRKKRGRGWIHCTIVNGLGAIATGITLLVVLVAKFTAGAWVSALLVLGLISCMAVVRRHYRLVSREVRSDSPLKLDHITPPIVVIPIHEWGKVSERALQFALTLSGDIRALHVAAEDEANALRDQWHKFVEAPVKRVGGIPPRLVTIPSPYRLVLQPILDYIQKVERANPGRQIAVVIPELVEKHWYHYPLHNQRAEMLKAFLLLKGSKQIVLINVPWYIKT